MQGPVVQSGCTSFRLNPFRRIDTSSNTTIGLKTGLVRHYVKKEIKDFRRNVAPLLFFVFFDVSKMLISIVVSSFHHCEFFRATKEKRNWSSYCFIHIVQSVNSLTCTVFLSSLPH